MVGVSEGAEAPPYSAVVIDDAYDDVPKWDEVPSDVLDELWQRSRFDVDPSLLRKVGVTADDPEALGATDVEALWERRGELPAPVAQVIDELLIDFAPGVPRTLSALTGAIREHLNCAPVTKGTDPPHASGDVDFVFLDHVLGPGTGILESEKAKERSLEVAREVLQEARKVDTRPIVVLMSSRTPSDEEKREFRESLGLAEDAFYFFPKSEFEDVNMLFLRLSALKQRRRLGAGAQHFAEEVQRAVVKAADRLSKAVYGLRAEDYVLIHAMSLREEGEPLGDYMLWLFGAFVGKELFELDKDVRDARRHLDEMQSEDLLPFHLLPSEALRRMYDAALYADVESLPSATAQVKHGDGTRWRTVQNAPLMLGHVYRSGKSDVWAVMNAACDLAARPRKDEKGEGKKLLPNPDLSIVMMHGRLVPIDEPTSHKGARTDLYEEDGHAHWIMWDVKRVEAVPYKSIDSWVNRHNARLAKRLRPEYALHLQREFTSSMTRVGLPVSPPIPQKTQGALYVRGADGTCQEIRTMSKPVGFVRIDRRDREDRAEWTCTINVAAELLGSLSVAVDQVAENRRRAEELGSEAAAIVKLLDKDLDVLRRAQTSLPGVMAFAQRLHLDPSGQSRLLTGTPIAVAAGYPIREAFPKNKGCALLLNIETKKKTDETESP